MGGFWLNCPWGLLWNSAAQYLHVSEHQHRHSAHHHVAACPPSVVAVSSVIMGRLLNCYGLKLKHVF